MESDEKDSGSRKATLNLSFLNTTKAGFAAGFITALALLGFLIVSQVIERNQGIASSRATGLAGFDNPMQLWSSNVFGGLFAKQTLFSKGGTFQKGHSSDYGNELKLVKTAGIFIETAEPSQTLLQVSALAEQLDGRLTSSTLTQEQEGAPEISATLLVPAERFDAALISIKQQAARVDSEHIETHDAGKEYVDLDAVLRNDRAEEVQYIEIMKRASSVHDPLEVSAHLSEVRGRIEKSQSEFQYLARQIAMAEISLTILKQLPAGPLQLHPIQRLKTAWQTGVASLADYVSGMVTLLAYLHALLLWMGTLFVLSSLAWRLVRIFWKALFRRPAVS